MISQNIRRGLVFAGTTVASAIIGASIANHMERARISTEIESVELSMNPSKLVRIDESLRDLTDDSFSMPTLDEYAFLKELNTAVRRMSASLKINQYLVPTADGLRKKIRDAKNARAEEKIEVIAEVLHDVNLRGKILHAVRIGRLKKEVEEWPPLGSGSRIPGLRVTPGFGKQSGGGWFSRIVIRFPTEQAIIGLGAELEQDARDFGAQLKRIGEAFQTYDTERLVVLLTMVREMINSQIAIERSIDSEIGVLTLRQARLGVKVRFSNRGGRVALIYPIGVLVVTLPSPEGEKLVRLTLKPKAPDEADPDDYTDRVKQLATKTGIDIEGIQGLLPTSQVSGFVVVKPNDSVTGEFVVDDVFLDESLDDT